uniref:RNA binding motif protein 39 n=1 Tax=Accipiter nisus TaxID=211598 RepID=A0A8B9LZ99_9AVES
MDLVKEYLMSSECCVFQGVFTSIYSHSRKNQFCADGKTNPLAFSLCSSASAVRWIYRKNANSSGPKFNSAIRGKIGLPHSIKLSRRRSRSKSPFRKDKSPVREPIDNLTPEERDARTVFCMQLAARIRPRDLEEFFSTVGKVRDVRMISDRNSRRSKGIAYVEFVDVSSVPLAIGLTGQRVLGVPIIVQASQAEKNRAAAMANNLQKGSAGPMRLYVGSLHFNITEDMLRGIFEPFGRIESIQLMMDSETGRSKGYGFITV